jgi:hypothetical protein
LAWNGTLRFDAQTSLRPDYAVNIARQDEKVRAEIAASTSSGAKKQSEKRATNFTATR